ncbi:MAG: hypothetical protein JRM82_03865, partial [Nitrososphaerota archaeon]|nr:hypothetical protein [Nitrososphaerota archaeon]
MVMPEGFDSRGESGETSEESLEGIRKELLEKYEQEEGVESTSGEKTEHQDSQKRIESVEPESERTGEPGKLSGDDSGDPKESAVEEGAVERAQPSAEEVEGSENEAGDSATSLEELRGKLREKYEQGEVMDGEDSGKVETAADTARQQLLAEREGEAGRSTSKESEESAVESPTNRDSGDQTIRSVDLSTGPGSLNASDETQEPRQEQLDGGETEVRKNPLGSAVYSGDSGEMAGQPTLDAQASAITE